MWLPGYLGTLQGYRKKRVILIRSFNVRFLNSSKQTLNLLHVVHAKCPNYIFKVDYLIRFQLGRLRIDRHFAFNIMKDAKINTSINQLNVTHQPWKSGVALSYSFGRHSYSFLIIKHEKTTGLSH